MKTLNSTYEPKNTDATLFTGRNNMGNYGDMDSMDWHEYSNREFMRIITFYPQISIKDAQRLADIRATYYERFKKSPPPYYGIVC